MSFLKVVLVSLVAPLIGLGVSIFASTSITDFSSGLSATPAWGSCAVDLALSRTWACDGPVELGWLGLGSIATFAVTIALLAVNRIAAALLGMHRMFLAMGFSIYALANLILVMGLGLAHLAILGAAAYLSALQWSDEMPAGALAILGLGAAGVLWVLLTQSLAFFRVPKSFIAARPISLYEHPRLGLLIRDVAKRTGGRVPDNVVLGLEPTFFATSAPVQTPYLKTPLKGQTLHLSLSLMNLLSADELKAVVGHELGHFSGADTQYSMRFAPALAGMHGAVAQISERRWTVPGFLMTPSRLLLEDFVLVFGGVHGRISRERESRADKLGAKAASPDDVAYSLLKASVGGSVWRGAMDSMIGRARKGRFSRNLVRNFSDQIKFDVDRQKLPPAIEFALGESQSHPTDSHPSTETRITSLGLQLDAVLEDDRVLAKFFNDKPCTSTLDNLAPIEEDLTTLYYHMLADEWRPMAPAERDGQEIFLTLVRDFMARMVTIDGKVDDREIVESEEIAVKLFGDFDREGFREICARPEDLPELDRLIELANVLLTETGAGNLKTALRKVAEADAQVLDSEIALLERIEQQLQPKPEEAK